MKRLVRTVSAFIVLMILSSFTVFATESYITLNGFAFHINENGLAVIHSYDDRSANVKIPEKLMGAYVTEIDDYAFFNDTSIRSVSFENASMLRRIGTNAFYGCTGLREISIPSGVTEIGFGVFQNCTSIETATLGDGITVLPSQTFYNCTSLKRIIVSDSLTSIGERSMALCASLEEIEIPDSVTSINDSAFENVGSSLVVYCAKGSYAESYCKQNEAISYNYVREYELGDANLDGVFNVLDATVIQRYKAGMDEIHIFRGKNYADVNKDGEVTIRDATLIQMKLARVITSF